MWLFHSYFYFGIFFQNGAYSSIKEDYRELQKFLSQFSDVMEAKDCRDTIVDGLFDFPANQILHYKELTVKFVNLSMLIPKGDGTRPVSRKDLKQFKEKVIQKSNYNKIFK